MLNKYQFAQRSCHTKIHSTYSNKAIHILQVMVESTSVACCILKCRSKKQQQKKADKILIMHNINGNKHYYYIK